MASDDRILEMVLSGRGRVPFRDLEHLLRALGFRLARTKGSHQIYVHPRVARPFPVQPDGREAKAYQVRQLRNMIDKYGLTLGADR